MIGYPLKNESFSGVVFDKFFVAMGHIFKQLADILYVSGVQLVINICNNMKNSLMAAALIAYSFFPKKPSIKCYTVHCFKLTVF